MGAPSDHNGRGGLVASEQQRRRVRVIAQRAVRGMTATPIDELDVLEEARLARQNRQLDLRQRYADRFLWLLAAQLLVADVVFVAYLQLGVHWHVPVPVVCAWLGLGLFQAVGLAWLLSRVAFPALRAAQEHRP